MKTTIFACVVLLVFFACGNNSTSQEAENMDNTNSEEINKLPLETPDKEATLAYLKSYDGVTFEDLEAKEKDVKDRMLQFMADTYFDITIPINASLGTFTLQDENLIVTGEIFHEGKPHLSILVFDLKNDNILGAVFDSDAQTLKSHIEKPNLPTPKVFTKWIDGFEK